MNLQDKATSSSAAAAAAAAASATPTDLFLFEDIFDVTELNPDKYQVGKNVHRVQATSITYECELLLDINNEIYKLSEGEKFTLAMSSTLNLDGSPTDHSSYNPNNEPTLADNYEYVCHGKVFHVQYCSSNNWKYDDGAGRWTCSKQCGCDEIPHQRWSSTANSLLSSASLSSSSSQNKGGGTVRSNDGDNNAGNGNNDNNHDIDLFVIIAISFGGLLMRVVGQPKHLGRLIRSNDQYVYLLIKKN